MRWNRSSTSRCPVAAVVCISFLLVFDSPVGGDRLAAEEAKAGDKKSDKKGEKKSKKKSEADSKAKEGKGKTGVAESSVDEAYVKEHLKDFLYPSEIDFLPDGRVKLVFSFRQKLDEHRGIFSIPMGKGMRAAFRYTIDQEERVVGGDYGLRVSDSGMALINAWFTDDVEAEMDFSQYINFSARHVAAVVFCNDKGKAIGANYGSQCATFSKGRIGKRAGKAEPVSFNSSAKIKLKVSEGVLEGYRQGQKGATMKYRQKSFSSGRIGFVWGGSISGIIPHVAITGKLDYKRMAAYLKKQRKD